MEKIRSFTSAVIAFFDGFLSKIGDFLSELQDRTGRAVEKFPQGLRQPAIIAAVIVATILNLIFASAKVRFFSQKPFFKK